MPAGSTGLTGQDVRPAVRDSRESLSLSSAEPVGDGRDVTSQVGAGALRESLAARPRPALARLLVSYRTSSVPRCAAPRPGPEMCRARAPTRCGDRDAH